MLVYDLRTRNRQESSLLKISDCLSALASVCDRNMEKSEIVVQLTAGFSAVLSMGCSGFHYGWPSPALPKLLADDSDIPMTSDESSWIVSFFTFGCVFGPIIGMLLVDRCGRKLTLLVTIIPYLVSSILLGLAQAFWWFLAARFIAGLGTGVSYVVVPMYLGEIADDRIRGALASLLILMSNSGTLLAYSVGPWVDRVVLAATGGALPLIFGLIFIWMPESPYFLVMKGKLDRAEKSLKCLKNSSDVKEELEKVQANVEFDHKNSGTMKDLLMVPGNRKALIIVLGLVLAQQFSGFGAVFAYAELIFEESRSSLDSSISVIIMGIILIASGVLTTFIVDSAGRRPLLLLSACGLILFLGGEALYFQLQASGNDVSAISWLPMTGIFGYIIMLTIGLASVPFVVLSEIFPCNVKALATTISSVAGSLGGMAVTKLYQVVADAYGIHASFWGFAGITVFSAVFIYFVLPETKKRSLRSIQEEFHKTTASSTKLETSSHQNDRNSYQGEI